MKIQSSDLNFAVFIQILKYKILLVVGPLHIWTISKIFEHSLEIRTQIIGAYKSSSEYATISKQFTTPKSKREKNCK